MWKEYGVRLNFKPTIIDEDHIRLELEPEVSTIDFSNGVRFNGFVVPALRTRRAKTGLNCAMVSRSRWPVCSTTPKPKRCREFRSLADIPVIGTLFKSKSFEKKETELMFFVTAHLVKPVNGDDLPNMRGIDGLKGSSPLGVEPKGEGISGQSGYKVSGQNERDSGFNASSWLLRPKLKNAKPKLARPRKAAPPDQSAVFATTIRPSGRESGEGRLQSGFSQTLVIASCLEFRSSFAAKGGST